MKKFNIQEIVDSLKSRHLVLNSEFFTIQESELKVPLLDQMDTLLDAIDEKGLKLTTKGNLPTAVVKAISLVNSSYEDQRYLKFTKRFMEDESLSAQRAHILAKHLKFIKVAKKRLYLTNKAKAYQALHASEKFVVLFDAYLSFNLGYFDGYDSFDLLNEIVPLYLFAIADEKSAYRTVEHYSKHFFTKNTQLTMTIILELLKVVDITLEDEELLDSKEKIFEVGKRHFNQLVKLRLFERFFALFGLIEERGDWYNSGVGDYKPYEVKKTPLLERFIVAQPTDIADTNLLLTKKMVHSFKKEIQEQQLDISDLFYDFVYLMSTLGNTPFPATELIVDNIIRQKMIIGTQAKIQTKLYTTFYEALKAVMLTFTQYAIASSQKEQLMIKFDEFIDALVLLVDTDKKPFIIYKQFEAMPMFLFDLFVKEYGIDLQSGNPDQIIQNHFNQEVSEDLENFFARLNLLQKESKKCKRVTKEYKTLLKDAIRLYVLAIFSLYTYQLENKIIAEDEKLPTPKSDGFAEKIFEFTITLQGINNPVIYRTIQVPSNFSFYDLHLLIQNAFDWKDSHLFEFNIKKKLIADYEDEFGEECILPAREILLEDEFKRKSQKALYLYDFGDNWEHEIVLKRSFEPEEGKKYPLCTEAQGNTPPEDVGGILGFEEFKEIMSDTSHPEYLEMKEWHGSEYDANDCSVEAINKRL